MVFRQLRAFDRRLPANGLAALENLISEPGSWWPDLLARWAPSGSEGCLRLAIRNGSINFYSNGQSIARITFGYGGRSPALGIHRKYVMGVQAPAGQKYFRLSSKEGRDAEGSRTAWGGPGMLRAWIRNSGYHSGDEKRCIEAVVASSPKVIDLEMGLPAFHRRNGALRMDMVALEQATNGIRLVFWEAKLIRDKRLRSGEHKPEVFKQIDAYRLYLSDADRRQCIVEAYRNACCIMRELHRMASTKTMIGPLDPLVREVAEPVGRLEIDEQPRLLIFGDDVKRRADAWQKHLEVLRGRVPVAVVANGTAGLVPLEKIPKDSG